MSRQIVAVSFVERIRMQPSERKTNRGRIMTHALNLTLPLKQDPETQKKLKELGEAFETKVQPVIENALRASRIVHFARVLVIDNKYIQVITEYEGPHKEYNEFFRKALTPVFAQIFALAEGAPDVNDQNAFWEYAKDHNLRSLGKTTTNSDDFNGDPAGYLFCAYDGMTVKELAPLKAVKDALRALLT